MTVPETSQGDIPLFLRLLLKVFPEDFRRAYAADLAATFAERRREIAHQGGWAICRFWIREILAVLREGWRLRRGRGGRRSAHGRLQHRSVVYPVVSGLFADLRYASRRLLAAPGFTVAAVLVLAFGIGANSAVFCALETAILTEPPYPEPDRLVIPFLVRHGTSASVTASTWSYPKFRVLRDFPDPSINPVAAYAVQRMALSGAGDATQIDVELVTPDYFRLLGLSAMVGRTFTADETDERSPPMIAVLGHGLWRDRFGSDPDIIGRQVTLDERSFTVVGVAPDGFAGATGRCQIWLPFAVSGTILEPWRFGVDVNWFYVMGRLTQGSSIEDAYAQMSLVAAAVQEAFPDGEGNEVFYEGRVHSFRTVATNRTARLSILVLFSAAALVLVIACANLAGLLLARATTRTRETAVRLAVGAGRWRIVRQLLCESLVLALVGGAIGLLVAHWGIAGLKSLAPGKLVSGSARLQFLDIADLQVDLAVVLFTVVLAVVTSVVFGLAPALRITRADLSTSLKDGVGTTSFGFSSRNVDFRSVLVGAQVAIAMVLLAGAGLMIGSLFKLQGVETGIDTDNLLSFSYNLPRFPSDDGDAAARDNMNFHAAFLTRLRALPGVTAASIGCPPLGGTCIDALVREIAGRPPIPREERVRVGADAVADGFFRTVGAQLMRGRDFTPINRAGPPLVAIVNESAARKIFPGEEALGQRLAIGITPEGQTAEIIGVVGDVRYEAERPREEPMVYVPLQHASGWLGGLLLQHVTVLVRTEGDPYSTVPAIRRLLSQQNPNIPLSSIATVESLGARAVATNRMIMRLLTVFALVAILLSAVGTYGVVAYAVSLRNKEIGLRVALGASSGQVLGSVLRRGVILGSVGVLAGICCAWGATRVLSSFLFEISATDPVTFGVGAAVLLGTAVIASYLPARRATRLDPMEVLRVE